MARIRGTNGDDALIGTALDDTIYGRRGDDVIHAGDGDDVVYGGGGRDTIFAGDGNNDVYGGGGRDTFAFESGAAGVTTLHDWQDGRDVIDLTGLGVSSLDQLQITTSGSWTTIAAGAMSIRMDAGANSAPLSAADFIFAAAPPPPPPPPPDPDPDPTPEPAFGFTLYDFEVNVTADDGGFAAAWDNLIGYNPEWFTGSLGAGNTYLVPRTLWYTGEEPGPMTVRADPNVTTVAEFDLERFETRTADDFTLIAYLDGAEVGRQTFGGVADGEWTQFSPDDAIFDVVDKVEFVGVADLDNILFDSAPPVAPTPDPVPANGTRYDFDASASYSDPGQGATIGDFAADFTGFGVINPTFGAGAGNGYLSEFLGSPVKSVRADMNLMTDDVFDFESFETRDPNGFSLVAFNDGVEIGRQDFAAVTDGIWTEMRPDDAIFDAVDEVRFIGLNDMDDVLFIA